MEERDCELTQRLKHMEQLMESMVVELATVKRGFPKNELGEVDMDGHRQYHESLMRAAQRQEEFWSELKIDLVKKGTMAVLVVVAGLIVTGIMVKLGIQAKP